MSVRPYEPRDRERVRRICIETAPHMPTPTEEARQILLTTYCDYYIEREPDSCFVLTDEADEAAGYILCAKNAERWARLLREEYLPRLSPAGQAVCLGSTELPLRFKDSYPAHLHIDILPSHQGKGLGRALLAALIAHLREAEIPGLMLGVDPKNANAIKFYEKHGFISLAATPQAIAMGLRL